MICGIEGLWWVMVGMRWFWDGVEFGELGSRRTWWVDGWQDLRGRVGVAHLKKVGRMLPIALPLEFGRVSRWTLRYTGWVKHWNPKDEVDSRCYLVVHHRLFHLGTKGTQQQLFWLAAKLFLYGCVEFEIRQRIFEKSRCIAFFITISFIGHEIP